ncbi:MAG: glycosyltransferase [Candidatus Eremiobacteraeota bacterium]|nr:glycosyltransferase [Candidatus Eremiobacteraeota bacterium]
MPRLACIIPFLNEEEHLPAVLASLREQTLDHARFVLIAVDNGSDDRGAELVSAWFERGPVAGRLVSAAARSIPYALNVGLESVQAGDIVVRLDAHTVYGPDYLAAIAEAFDSLEPDVWCVGGAPTPAPARGFLRGLGDALYSNPMGLGPADFRQSLQTVRRVSTVYLGAWRPGVLQRLGGFDERWAANEDCELTERIRASGGAIARIPLTCGRISTRGPLATIRQWSRYGFWRMQTLKRYPQAVRPRHVAAPVALLLGLGLLASPWRLALLPLYVMYAATTIAFRRKGEPGAVTAGSLVFFPLVHCGFAGGLIIGALRTPESIRNGVARRDHRVTSATPAVTGGEA